MDMTKPDMVPLTSGRDACKYPVRMQHDSHNASMFQVNAQYFYALKYHLRGLNAAARVA
jgi:hypothetical protein